MSRFAIDTGPLVAFINGGDRYHSWAVEALDTIAPPLVTCEAVLSEASFLLRRSRRGQDAVLALIERGVLGVAFRLGDELPAVRKAMAKYASVPMSLADACLLRMSELETGLTILTLDKDFRLYRRLGRRLVPVLMP